MMYFKNNSNKYRAVKTEYNGIIFDSKKEANRYAELLILQKAGEISDLQIQVPFILIPEQREEDYLSPRGKLRKGKLLERECKYVADFVYKDKDGNTVVEDTKGVRTVDYKVKRKLMLYIHGIRIREV